MSAKYVDGVYVFTLAKGITIPNFSKLSPVSPSVKMIGNGNSFTLQYGTQLKDLTLDGVSYKSTDLTVQSLTIIGETSIDAKLNATDFVVDNGSFTCDGNIESTSITVKNKGALTINGSVTVTKLLLVESGATFNATGVNSDTVIIKNGAVAELYGNVVIQAAEGKTGIIFVKETSALYLKDTSRVTVSGGNFTIGHFSTDVNVKVYYPSGATVANNKITSANGNTLLSYGAICKIEFVAES